VFHAAIRVASARRSIRRLPYSGKRELGTAGIPESHLVGLREFNLINGPPEGHLDFYAVIIAEGVSPTRIPNDDRTVIRKFPDNSFRIIRCAPFSDNIVGRSAACRQDTEKCETE